MNYLYIPSVAILVYFVICFAAKISIYWATAIAILVAVLTLVISLVLIFTGSPDIIVLFSEEVFKLSLALTFSRLNKKLAFISICAFSLVEFGIIKELFILNLDGISKLYFENNVSFTILLYFSAAIMHSITGVIYIINGSTIKRATTALVICSVFHTLFNFSRGLYGHSANPTKLDSIFLTLELIVLSTFCFYLVSRLFDQINGEERGSVAHGHAQFSRDGLNGRG